jgi:CHAD domain-containing protein
MSKPAPIEGVDRETAVGEAAHRAITTRLSEVRAFEGRLNEERGAIDADLVHDMRVASRRLRASLELFDRKRQLRRAEKAVRALGDALGEVREIHVQLQWLGDAAKQVADKERPGLVALRAEREAKLPRRIERLQAALEAWKSDGAPAVEIALGELELGGRLGGKRVRGRIARRLKSVRRRMKAALQSTDPQTAHRLRIGAKKLRYLAELCQPAFPSEMDVTIDRVTPLQQTLGDLHDADVHVPLVEKFLVRADGNTQPGALALLRSEMARRDQLAADLSDALARFRDDGVLEQLRDALC